MALSCAEYSQNAIKLRLSPIRDSNGRDEARSIEIVSAAHLSKPSNPPLLVFDGDCAFCTTWVHRLEKFLPRFPTATPWQWLELDELGLSVDDVTNYAWVVTSRHQYAGHLAFSALLRMQRGFGWRLAGHLIATPPVSWLAAAAYHYIAKYRHKLPGGTPACAMRPAE